MRGIVETLPKGVIGVVVSGGFDSTILWHYLYGLCKERKQKIIPFTVPKNDGALTYATRMLQWSAKRYNDKTLSPIVINSKGVDWDRKDYQGEEVAQQLLGGIKDIMNPEYGDPPKVFKNNEIPVFWACGVTPQSVLQDSKPDFCITHSPGKMLITDKLNNDLAAL